MFMWHLELCSFTKLTLQPVIYFHTVIQISRLEKNQRNVLNDFKPFWNEESKGRCTKWKKLLESLTRLLGLSWNSVVLLNRERQERIVVWQPEASSVVNMTITKFWWLKYDYYHMTRRALRAIP